MKTFFKILNLLSSSERRDATLLLLMITIMAILDMIGVASILPFMAVVANPDLIETNTILNLMFQLSNNFGVNNFSQFLFALGVMVFVLLIISLTFKAITTFASVRFVRMREHSIGKRLVEVYLNQPYEWFLNRHSSDLGKNILSEVNLIVAGAINPFMEIISKGMIIMAIIILLILIDPKLAIYTGVLFAGVYALIYKFTQNYLNKIGEERQKSNQARFTTISDAFGAIKEIKVGSLEQIYLERFSNHAKKFASKQASAAVVGLLPRFGMEAIAFGGILVVILYLISKTGDFINALPIISLYVFAGYRLMPALQQIYLSFTQIAFVHSSLEIINRDLKNLTNNKLDSVNNFLTIKKQISLKNISYTYPNTISPTLKNVNISIPVKSTVGLVGATGSGKTTLVDVILSLLEPQKGTLKVDDQNVNKLNSRSWLSFIGYVPQNIYLTDDTVAANIALGVDSKNIDQLAIEKSSKIANLHEFVTNEMPNQYETVIGEKGVRLSGGQRQRIGIARALYRKPKVLILDEATSALDNETELAVMTAINTLRKDMTIIIIAHRLNTIKNCDIIFKIQKNGDIKKINYEDLI